MASSKREPLEGRRHVNVQRGLPDALQQALDQGVDVLALDERHLDVNLAELELAVGALVLVAEAAGDLVIALDAADHEDLLELLRRLRQRVERPRLAAVRHEELARALGRALEEDRRLDFQKALLVHEHPRGGGHFAAHAQVARHLRPAQIEVAILEPQSPRSPCWPLPGRPPGRAAPRRCSAPRARVTMTSTSPVGIFGLFVPSGRARTLPVTRTTHSLRSAAAWSKRSLGRSDGSKTRLGAPFAVAHVDEDHAAQVAPGVDPAVEGDDLADVRRAQFVAVMRTFHEFKCEGECCRGKGRIQRQFWSADNPGRRRLTYRLFISARNGRPSRYFRKPPKSNCARMQPSVSPASAKTSPCGSTMTERPV